MLRTASLSARSGLPCLVLAGVVLVAGCTSGGGSGRAATGDDGQRLRATSSDRAPSAAPAPSTPAAPAPSPTSAARPPAVAPLGALREADVRVTSATPLPASVRARLAALASPGADVTYRSGAVLLAGRRTSVVGVDPSRFRAFTAQTTAGSDAVWQAVARGEAVVSHEVAGTALVPGSRITVAPAPDPDRAPAPEGAGQLQLRLGALATTGVPGADLVVDEPTAARLGVPVATGVLLVAPEGSDPVELAEEVRRVAGSAAVDLVRTPAPVARLTGGEAAQDLGAFSYRYFSDGTIQPDERWVRENIRTETVPLFGRVTCHRLMLPQLRGALQEVVDAGLSSTLTTYDGCYVPRFIERNPARSISLHTWGIAIDLDAATNYRGIRGTMDPRVVAIFKRWGFRWGGDWAYTDPMHFELGTILSSPPG